MFNAIRFLSQYSERTFREDDILIAIVPMVKNKAALYF